MNEQLEFTVSTWRTSIDAKIKALIEPICGELMDPPDSPGALFWNGIREIWQYNIVGNIVSVRFDRAVCSPVSGAHKIALHAPFSAEEGNYHNPSSPERVWLREQAHQILCDYFDRAAKVSMKEDAK